MSMRKILQFFYADVNSIDYLTLSNSAGTRDDSIVMAHPITRTDAVCPTTFMAYFYKKTRCGSSTQNRTKNLGPWIAKIKTIWRLDTKKKPVLRRSLIDKNALTTIAIRIAKCLL